MGQASNGTSRADGWSHLPLIRMTNISLEPREGSLAEIIGDTKDGIFMATNQSWSIDDKRINFQFGCEIAWRIKDGALTAALQEPELHRDHAGVLGLVRRRRRTRGVDGVGHAELRQGPAGTGGPRGARHLAGALPQRPGGGALMPGLIGEDGFRAVAAAALELPGVDGVEVLFMHEWGGLTRFANSEIHQIDVPRGHRTADPGGVRTGGPASRRRTTSPSAGRARAAASAKEMAEVAAPDPLFPGLAPKADVPDVDRFFEAPPTPPRRRAPKPSRS